MRSIRTNVFSVTITKCSVSWGLFNETRICWSGRLTGVRSSEAAHDYPYPPNQGHPQAAIRSCRGETERKHCLLSSYISRYVAILDARVLHSWFSMIPVRPPLTATSTITRASSSTLMPLSSAPRMAYNSPAPFAPTAQGRTMAVSKPGLRSCRSNSWFSTSP